MKIFATEMPGVLRVEPRVFSDERGSFFESYNRQAFLDQAGFEPQFVQDNHSRSVLDVVRGLHYQVRQPQGKLVRVIAGCAFDVVVDIRRSSPTFGRWFGCELSARNRTALWIPVGFAHGFAALEDGTEVVYKATDFWAPEHERTILWKDPRIGIRWPLSSEPILSPKDRAGLPLLNAEVFP